MTESLLISTSIPPKDEGEASMSLEPVRDDERLTGDEEFAKKIFCSLSTCSLSQSSSPSGSLEESLHEICLKDDGEETPTPSYNHSLNISWDDFAPTNTTLRSREGIPVSSELSTLEAVFERIRGLFPDTSAGFFPVNLPTFHRKELVTGVRLGRGCFSDVFELERIRGHPEEKKQGQGGDSEEFTMASQCLTPLGETRYALKCLQEDARNDPINAWMNFADMVVETRLLSQLVHPNIIKLRAVGGHEELSPHYFIILDKLYDTLSARIKKWKLENAENKQGLRRFIGRKAREAKTSLWEKRLIYAYRLAGALEHMHKHKVIHRDVKPENIGFDVVSIQKANLKLCTRAAP